MERWRQLAEKRKSKKRKKEAKLLGEMAERARREEEERKGEEERQQATLESESREAVLLGEISEWKKKGATFLEELIAAKKKEVALRADLLCSKQEITTTEKKIRAELQEGFERKKREEISALKEKHGSALKLLEERMRKELQGREEETRDLKALHESLQRQHESLLKEKSELEAGKVCGCCGYCFFRVSNYYLLTRTLPHFNRRTM